MHEDNSRLLMRQDPDDGKIGTGIHDDGFADHEVRALWAALGYHDGPVALDAFIDAFHAAWRPGEPATLSVYLRPDNGVDPRIKAGVASQVLPHYGAAGKAWCEIRLQQMEADAAADPDRRALLREQARDYLIACVETTWRESRCRGSSVGRKKQRTGRASRPAHPAAGQRRVLRKPRWGTPPAAPCRPNRRLPTSARRWRSVAASGLMPTTRGAGCKWASSDGSSLVT